MVDVVDASAVFEQIDRTIAEYNSLMTRTDRSNIVFYRKAIQALQVVRGKVQLLPKYAVELPAPDEG